MDKWSDLLQQYLTVSDVNEIVFVKYIKESSAEVSMYEKQDGSWCELFTCDAHVGKNGIGKEKEGDWKTPIGIFSLSAPFGTADDPGAVLGYTKIHENLYWCADPDHYNRMIDIREHPHKCSGERLLDYYVDYTYAMYISYNDECVYGKGCAIFFHCFGKHPYTAGCVAIDENNMRTVLQHAHAGAKICIFDK